MKDKFENSIKESLENFELPYDANAWNSLSKQLDITQPVNTFPKSGFSSAKWIVAAGIIAVVSLGTYYIISNASTEKEALLSETNATTETKSTEISTEKENQPLKNTSSAPDDTQNLTPTVSTHTNGTKEQTSENSQKVEKSSSSTNIVKGSELEITEKTSTESSKGTELKSNPIEIQKSSVIVPVVKDLCQGEFASVKNENSFDLTILTPQRDRITVRPSKSLKFELNQAGEYRILNGSDEIAHFNVGNAPKIDFTIDEQTQFEDGVPSIPIATYSDGTNFVWNFEGTKVTQQGKKAKAHFFTKGTKTITLTVESEKGCRSEISKTVTISEDYNLFAPNAFEPTHTDFRRNRFIPAALLVRDVQFTLFIVDPKTGNTLYATSNANDGWDGIDKNTGELVPQNSTYVWKVVLSNPLPGEKSEYSGTVLRR